MISGVLIPRSIEHAPIDRPENSLKRTEMNCDGKNFSASLRGDTKPERDPCSKGRNLSDADPSGTLRHFEPGSDSD